MPIRLMTVSREHGSGGRQLAEAVAKALGWRCVDKEIALRIARELQRPVEEVEKLDENPDGPFVRALKRTLVPNLPEDATMAMGGIPVSGTVVPPVPELPEERAQALPVLDEDAYAELTRNTITFIAEQGGAVIVGRGGQAILAGREDTVHIRVCAPEAERRRRLREREEIDAKEARKQVQDTDAARRRYLRRHHDVEWADPGIYHLTMNTGMVEIPDAADLLASLCKALSRAG